ncbi:Phosphatidate cytidylyltransferase [Candidatus Desulfarcum epimagneticum]|uniref:Phosphatidate cytidylyltransferase n=1 Tax=uncultured Desulfobacteraceae bacterium TaxID=218296 RepID=A0A484HIC8_9BACT|nr:Phosphatidate cytidylyltransferase [uncultured Desulfobacteraceae bacterium]
MLLKRWITALCLTPFIVWLILMGSGDHFALFVAAVSLVALWEYFGIVLPRTPKTHPDILAVFAASPPLIWSVHISRFDIAAGLMTLTVLLFGAASIAGFKKDAEVGKKAAFGLLGIVYVSLFLSWAVLIRDGRDGIVWIFILAVSVFAGDTGAYYAGTRLGRRPLCPFVSPKKTVEGAIGGLAATVCAGSAIKFFFLPALPWGAVILALVLTGVFAQAGDLFESVLKRASGIKDSGKILPGHGGLLDRIDGILFAAPVVCFFQRFLAGGG